MSDLSVGTKNYSNIQETQKANNEHENTVSSSSAMDEICKAAEQITHECNTSENKAKSTNEKAENPIISNKDIDNKTQKVITKYLSKAHEAYKAGYTISKDVGHDLNTLIKSTGTNPFVKADLGRTINNQILQYQSNDHSANLPTDQKITNAKYNLDAFLVMAQGADHATKAACATNAIAYLSNLMASTSIKGSNQIIEKFTESALAYLAFNKDTTAAAPFKDALKEIIDNFKTLANNSNDKHNMGVGWVLNNFVNTLIFQRETSNRIYSQISICDERTDPKKPHVYVDISACQGLFNREKITDQLNCNFPDIFDSLGSILDHKTAKFSNRIQDIEAFSKMFFQQLSSENFYEANKLINCIRVLNTQAADILQGEFEHAIMPHAMNILNSYFDLKDTKDIGDKKFLQCTFDTMSLRDLQEITDKIGFLAGEDLSRIKQYCAKNISKIFNDTYADGSSLFDYCYPVMSKLICLKCMSEIVDPVVGTQFLPQELERQTNSSNKNLQEICSELRTSFINNKLKHNKNTSKTVELYVDKFASKFADANLDTIANFKKLNGHLFNTLVHQVAKKGININSIDQNTPNSTAHTDSTPKVQGQTKVKNQLFANDAIKNLNAILKATQSDVFAEAQLSKNMNNFMEELKAAGPLLPNLEDEIFRVSQHVATAKQNLEAFIAIAHGQDDKTKASCATYAFDYLSKLISATSIKNNTDLCETFKQQAIDYLSANENKDAAHDHAKNLIKTVNTILNEAHRNYDLDDIGIAKLINSFTRDFINIRDTTSNIASNASIYEGKWKLGGPTVYTDISKFNDLFDFDKEKLELSCTKRNIFDHLGSLPGSRLSSSNFKEQVERVESLSKNFIDELGAENFYEANKSLACIKLLSPNVSNELQTVYDGAIESYAKKILDSYLKVTSAGDQLFLESNFKDLSAKDLKNVMDRITDIFDNNSNKIKDFCSKEVSLLFKQTYPDGSSLLDYCYPKLAKLLGDKIQNAIIGTIEDRKKLEDNAFNINSTYSLDIHYSKVKESFINDYIKHDAKESFNSLLESNLNKFSNYFKQNRAFIHNVCQSQGQIICNILSGIYVNLDQEPEKTTEVSKGVQTDNSNLDSAAQEAVKNYFTLLEHPSKTNDPANQMLAKALNDVALSTSLDAFAKVELDSSLNEKIERLQNNILNEKLPGGSNIANAKSNLDAFLALGHGADDNIKAMSALNAIGYLSSLISTTTISDRSNLNTKFNEAVFPYLGFNGDSKAAAPYKEALIDAVNNLMRQAENSKDDHNIGIAMLVKSFANDLIDNREACSHIYNSFQPQTSASLVKDQAVANEAIKDSSSLFTWNEQNNMLKVQGMDSFNHIGSIIGKSVPLVKESINQIQALGKNFSDLMLAGDFFEAKKLILVANTLHTDAANKMQEFFDKAMSAYANSIVEKYLVINDKKFDSSNLNKFDVQDLEVLANKINELNGRFDKYDASKSANLSNYELMNIAQAKSKVKNFNELNENFSKIIDLCSKEIDPSFAKSYSNSSSLYFYCYPFLINKINDVFMSSKMADVINMPSINLIKIQIDTQMKKMDSLTANTKDRRAQRLQSANARGEGHRKMSLSAFMGSKASASNNTPQQLLDKEQNRLRSVENVKQTIDANQNRMDEIETAIINNYMQMGLNLTNALSKLKNKMDFQNEV